MDLISDIVRKFGELRVSVLAPNLAIRMLYAEGDSLRLKTMLPPSGIDLPEISADLGDQLVMLMLSEGASWPGSSPSWTGGACSEEALLMLQASTSDAMRAITAQLDITAYGQVFPVDGELPTPPCTLMLPSLARPLFTDACFVPGQPKS